MTKQILSSIKVSLLALFVSFGVSYVYAWTAPTATPPTGNVSAPINTSATAQTKAGSFNISAGDSSFTLFGPNASWAGKLFVGASPDQSGALTAQVISTDGNLHLDPAPGKNMYLGYYKPRDIYINPLGGNVGIGTTNPLSTLSVGANGSANTGVYGFGVSTGVQGSGSGYGVYGSSSSYIGVSGVSGTYIGVSGSGGKYGVYAYGAVNDFYGSHGAYTSGGTWVNGSSRDLKENFKSLDNQSILSKIIELPMTEWNYKTAKDAKHIGPIAQDFYSIFGLGDSNKSISTIDPAGISLVGIKALNEKIVDQQRQIDALIARIEKLEARK